MTIGRYLGGLDWAYIIAGTKGIVTKIFTIILRDLVRENACEYG